MHPIMKILLIPILAITATMLSCKPNEAAKAEAAKAEAAKITESEFYSLKKADDALIKWTKDLITTYLAGRSFTDNDNVKEIMDGAI